MLKTDSVDVELSGGWSIFERGAGDILIGNSFLYILCQLLQDSNILLVVQVHRLQS